MFQTANTDFFNHLVHKAHNRKCQNLILPLQIKPGNVNLKLVGGFYFLHPRH